MLYINVITGAVTQNYDDTKYAPQSWEHRNDWKTNLDAATAAESANLYAEEHDLDVSYLAVDRGRHVAPRYDVIVKPAVGDDVSYGFNGDFYPCGQIKSISKSLKLITTTDGSKFYRKRQTGQWIKDKTWILVKGHLDKRNPSF